MGNRIFFSGNETLEDFMLKFNLIRREYNPSFGEVKICQSKSDPTLKVMLKERWFNDEKSYTQFKKTLENRKVISKKNAAGIIIALTRKTDQWCSSDFRCSLVYEFHDKTLSKLLREKHGSRNREEVKFSEDDIWAIITDLVKGLKSFYDSGISYGDVQPRNIFVLKNNRMKLIDSCFMNQAGSGFERRSTDLDYFTPLGPQALTRIRFGAGIFNPEKNDIWGLGMTLLSMVYLEDYNTYYDWQRYEINYELLRTQVNNLTEQGYSEKLKKFIKQLFRVEETSRPSLYTLNNLLSASHRSTGLRRGISQRRLIAGSIRRGGQN